MNFQRIDRTKLNLIVKCFPALLFALFTVLIFFFYLAPVVEFPSISEYFEISGQNVYHLGANPLLDDLRGAANALIAFAVIALFFAIAGIFFLETPFFDFSRSKHGTVIKILRFVWKFLPFLFYFAFLLIAFTIFGTIGTMNEKLTAIGLFAAGACPVLITVFSLIFAAMTILSLFLEFRVLNKPRFITPEE